MQWLGGVEFNSGEGENSLKEKWADDDTHDSKTEHLKYNAINFNVVAPSHSHTRNMCHAAQHKKNWKTHLN